MIKNCGFLIQISIDPEMNCDFHDFNSAAYVLFGKESKENVSVGFSLNNTSGLI